MVSLEVVQTTSRSIEPTSSPRISFSADFLDENDFITISPNPHGEHQDKKKECDQKARNADFEFLSNNESSHAMLSADELFFEGKLLPFWQKKHAERLDKIRLKTKDDEICEEEVVNKEESRGNWFVDDDPSPRPPKCTVLWKELLRLKKQRASTLSPSSSSSSSSSSNSFADVAAADQEKEMGNKEKYMKRIKKGLERTRSARIRIRPMVNVPICTQMKNSALPPLFPLRKGRLDR
ncbi:uncharacterized protein LOC126791860 [Argentina anserina]|uniref:uncharacterized protein LOC126791860 n=1 Tax=Argentina anserina TaxID=57926 RepID=UPI00217637BC|nr:uncharacterized protein LOC126791860 [Potentilla anserina]